MQLVTCARWWSEHRDADQATRWLHGLEEAIGSLDEYPERHLHGA